MPKFDLSVYPNLLKAAELLDESNYTQEQLNAYDRHLLAVYDINMSRIESFDEGFDEGLKRGREEGRQEGSDQGREEGREEGIHLSAPIIKELLKGELSHEEIAERFSVSVQLVTKLAEELK